VGILSLFKNKSSHVRVSVCPSYEHQIWYEEFLYLLSDQVYFFDGTPLHPQYEKGITLEIIKLET